MKRFLVLAGLALWFCSCNNSGSSQTNADSSSSTNAAVTTDTNNASKNTGTDMSGGVNSGALADSLKGTDSGTGNRNRQ